MAFSEKIVMYYGNRNIKNISAEVAPDAKKLILNKTFQSKYSAYMMIAIAGSCLIFFIPLMYFTYQNYHVFTKLAYTTQPLVVKYLEREITWISVFSIMSLVTIIILTGILTLKMTKNMMSPIQKIENHLKKLITGHWSTPFPSINNDEDYKELIIAYDYFYRSLKTATENELNKLERLQIDPHNREAYAAWKSLINIKRTQLGISRLANDADEVKIKPQNLRKVA